MQDFSPQSKVWVYMADREFTGDETANLQKVLAEFTKYWTAHDQQLKAHGEVLHSRFIVLAVDETQAGASGCSIDKSVHLLKQIEKQLAVNLFDRRIIAYRKNGELKTANIEDFDSLFTSGELAADTIVYNNAITTKAQFDTEWETTIDQCWMKRFIPEQTLKH